VPAFFATVHGWLERRRVARGAAINGNFDEFDQISE
jgi:hypothetical protein